MEDIDLYHPSKLAVVDPLSPQCNTEGHNAVLLCDNDTQSVMYNMLEKDDLQWTLKECLNVLTPITSLVNRSLLGVIPFPQCPRRLHMSNLWSRTHSFWKKTWVTTTPSCTKLCLQNHWDCFGIKNQGTDACNPFQSVYKKFHSTETALLKILNDVLSETK